MKNTLRKDIKKLFEEHQVDIMFIDKISDNEYKVKIEKEDFNEDLLNSLCKKYYVRIKNSFYMYHYTLKVNCVSIFIKKI